MKKSYTRSRL